MSTKMMFLTREGYEKLKKELQFLKTVRRREISRQLAEARMHGDISENAEYDAATEAQTLLEMKISLLENRLSRARIIDEESIPKDRVYLGTTVLLRDLESGGETEYTLVGEGETDLFQHKISVTSPVGRGLLGHKEGDIVEVAVPAGILKYKILKISR